MNSRIYIENPDVVLVGSGIMSAHLGVLLKRLAPELRIQLYEVTEGLAQESSDGWNNAGTGHAGLCELSYTPQRLAGGRVDVSKAIEIFEQFEYSLQFWAHAVECGVLGPPSSFINSVPHLSFVHGPEQVDFLRARYAALCEHHFFAGMEFSTDPAVIASWAPLLIEGHPQIPVAATRASGGTDVNFGELSRQLLAWLGRQKGCAIATGHRVVDLHKTTAGKWVVRAKHLSKGTVQTSKTRFIFVGAGGGSILLLQKAGVAEAKGLGGFPIGGQWLVCENPSVVRRHQAKVYGQPLDAAPTMAVPHLDTRLLDGKKTLLFGPFGSWTTKFLHAKGSWTDLPRSVRLHNAGTLLKIGLSNFELVKYLMQQGTQSMEDRLAVLRFFYPDANPADWKLRDGGIRVQAIKKTDGQAGIVHYGTEVITTPDRTLSALLGASPGASVAVHIGVEVIRKCFPQLLSSGAGLARMREMIAIFDEEIAAPSRAAYFAERHAHAMKALQLL